MKWTKASHRHCDAYIACLKVFFDDPFARYSVLSANTGSREWKLLNPTQTSGTTSVDSKRASAYHQFMVISFAKLSDTRRWWVHPDEGFFKSERMWRSVEYLFNRTYKQAFGLKTSRVIRLVCSLDSHSEDLLQLSDIILGAVSALEIRHVPRSACRQTLVQHMRWGLRARPHTTRGLAKVQIAHWTDPRQFDYGEARSTKPYLPS